MIKESITFDASTGGGNMIAGFFCPANIRAEGGKSKGVIQICHGMADHFSRYDEMIEYLNGRGFDVCGMDMMGHGQTYELRAKERFGDDVPYFLYGHSMGSFVCRNIYITPEYSKEFEAFIFASTMGPNPAAGAGLALTNMMKIFGRKRAPGKLVNKIAFGTYNRRIDKPKTEFDWVTSDEKEVEKYIADPYAGFLFTNKGFSDLFKLVIRMQKTDAYDSIPLEKPVMLTYGEDDPVGNYGVGVKDVCEILRSKGIVVTEKNYGHYRHEIQNESVRWDYFQDIADFFTRTVEG